MMISPMELISYIIIGLIIGTFIAGYRPKKSSIKTLSVIKQIKDALTYKDLVGRIIKDPDDERSRIKNIINITNPTQTGIAAEVFQLDLPVIHQTSIDLLGITNGVNYPKIGLGIAKDIPNINMDIGIGAVKQIDKLFDSSKPDYMIYMGIHF
jgi:hypothetical protein